MRERNFGSAVRWAAATGVIAVGTYWAYNPPESSAFIQRGAIIAQEQSLSNELYAEGALDVNMVLSPILVPAWDVRVIDASNPKMQEYSSLIRQERELSSQIAREQGPIQTPLRNALGVIGPLFAIAFVGRTMDEFLGYRRDTGNGVISQVSQE